MIYDENEHELNEWIDELQEHNKNLQKQIKEGDKLWLKLKQKLERENKKLKEEIEKKDTQYEKLQAENDNLYGKIDDLKRFVYIVNEETGEITDTKYCDSLKTPKYRKWRKDNLQARIVYECNDDDSDLQVIHYIKYLEG
jgi:predicted RNase H-like nuclease (RuvC/YqgF family)